MDKYEYLKNESLAIDAFRGIRRTNTEIEWEE